MKMFRYYSTQRPVGPGTYPKPEDNRVANIENFDQRTFCEAISREAWGFVEYHAPLEQRDISRYELVEPGPFYMNRETGEVLSRQAMLRQFDYDYDGGDVTNPIGFEEYYEEVQVQ
jgi:hypothetical protein